MKALQQAEPYASVNPYFLAVGVADVYDALYRDRLKDVAFYIAAARAHGSALVIGCGSGRVLRELTRYHVDAVGIDVSVEMLRNAVERDAGMRVFAGDMRTFVLRKRVAAALMPFNTLYYNLSLPDACATLKSIRSSLVSDGVVYADFFRVTSASKADHTGGARVRVVSTRNGRVQLREQCTFDDREQRLDCCVSLTYMDHAIKPVLVRKLLRWYTTGELHEISARAGFSSVHVRNAFDLGEVTERTRRLVAVFRA